MLTLRSLPLCAVASTLLLGACATTGSVDELDRRVHSLEQQLAAQTGSRYAGEAEQALRRRD
jgi:hypothetical protein